ncbi:MAG: hypothetical protein U0941_21605 [Planctomycetaceae bacterium]
MTCDSESTDSEIHTTSASNPIDIYDPPDETSAGLGEVVVLQDCAIGASGIIDTVNFPGLSGKLRRIFARLNGSSREQEGRVSGDTWLVTGIPDAHWNSAGLVQTVIVRGIFDIPQPNEISNQKQFISRTGYSSCQYSSFGNTFGTLPIDEVVPRYFRVSAEFLERQCFGLLVGDLLSHGHLTLAYDSTISTPECPVWRDIGLPHSIGGWMLRVIRMGHCCYEARLSVQSSTESCILPATILLTRNWSFRKRNLFHGSFVFGKSKTDVTLTVEPL